MTTLAFDAAGLAALEAGEIAVLGVPYDERSSYLRGAALAPPRIREALHSPSANMTSESGRDLSGLADWRDLGDLGALQGELALDAIEQAVGQILDRGGRTICLGGDHSIAYPILRAYGPRHPQLTVLQIDAHPDLYDSFEGDRFSHACPFARVMEQGLVRRLVQVGIRTCNPHQRAQAERFGVEIIEMRHWHTGLDLRLEGPLYLSLDLDALDPAFAPGVSHHEPGGLSSRELLSIIQGLPGTLVGADIVEYNPTRDDLGITGMLAAKLLREIIDKML